LSIHYEKKVFILIDEYDKPLNFAYHYDYFDELSDFMKSFLSAGLKTNPYLEKGIMTGILRLSKANMLSGLNNLKEYTLLDNTYAPYFGFTEEEVTHTFTVNGLAHDLEKVKAWYNGYNIGGLVIYNPWSIMNCVDNQGELRAYWVDTADNSLIEKSIVNASTQTKEQLKILLEGKSIQVSIQRHVVFDHLISQSSALWSLLLFAGYLRLDDPHYEYVDGKTLYKVKIPNQEVMYLFFDFLTRWFEDKIGGEDNAIACAKHLLAGDVEGFTRLLKLYLLDASFHDTSNQAEMFYHGFLYALLIQLRNTHQIHSNRESGFGRYDIAICPQTDKQGDLGILLEFKRVKKTEHLEAAAKEALQQIHDKQYDHELQQKLHIKKILRIGMAFSGKAVTAAYQYWDCAQGTLSEVVMI
jgi:hypothetical protein